MSNIKEVVGGDQGRLPEVVTFETAPEVGESSGKENVWRKEPVQGHEMV